ncbi:hypothetical protein [Pseudobacteroides cellulosolvens]|uniref:Uncharacterized protein n=1 Tax=Pseudobacteroides cellulosolvens ATCC 35603 = DSM 2933 TaxID=398512 RepID=A0A0L6JR73_9FIRM|nr:hypothetical protein [Pseudobacteroides cellulosolvens]KNY27882.1 hypothetical protein Bccel_3153 [Pseudobacteroides cellulosolvens ATCC 35603 = DSM 2933]
MSLKNYSTARRYIAYVSSFGTTQLHLRSPVVMAFWSAMFPGFGHLLLSKYIRGFLLFTWEVYVNIQGHINLGILYSFTGKFDKAKEVLDTKWMLLYVPTFLFAIWDSYRTTVDLNNQYILAAREDSDVKPFKMDTIEINYLDKKAPWSSVIWSFIMPGVGQLSIHRIVTAFFILIWWIAIIYYSNFLPAIHHIFMGNFEVAKAVLDPQWTLNIPSIYFFTIYDAYINTVESNKLFDWEQAKFLKRNYQDSSFKMPLIKNTGSKHMYIISTFEHSIHLEKAITLIQMKGIEKENILAIPMDIRRQESKLIDTFHHSDGLSFLDLPFILGSFLTLFGGIYGFILTWGPIIWGLIGLVVGFGIGLAIKIVAAKKYSSWRTNKRVSEVVLIIECKEQQIDTIKGILLSHNAFGVRILDLNKK